jgi:glycosyltransferase involved in cell wall biosynthesis
MRIAIDSNVFTMQKYGGVSRYLVRLSEELIRLGNEVEIHGWLHTNRHLEDSASSLTRMRYIGHFPRHTRRIAHHAGDLLAGGHLARHRPDLIHESFCHKRRVGPIGIPRVCTVHDMIHELYPQFWGPMDRTPEYRKATIARCQAVICVSESTKRDLLRLVDLDPCKVHVIHHGFEGNTSRQELGPDEERLLHSSVTRPFLLYVGARHSYKNFVGLLHGLAQAGMSKDIGIIAFGGGPLKPVEVEEISKLGFKAGSVRQISGSDALLAALYRKAEAFVYPSIYEGFGFPPLEAMAEGCPVISSNVSSMPEVIGDAAEFFDPAEIETMAAALDAVIQSETRRNELRELGFQRIQCYPWSECAAKTEAIYRGITSKIN